MRLLRRRRRDLDERVKRAQRAAEESRRRLEHAREHVIAPLDGRAERNEFAELIRMSLREGEVR